MSITITIDEDLLGVETTLGGDHSRDVGAVEILHHDVEQALVGLAVPSHPLSLRRFSVFMVFYQGIRE